MNCLLVAATGFEIVPFTTHYRDNANELYDNVSLDILVTGIGLTAATYSISRQVQIKRPGLIIQAGIAGSFDRGLALGSVVAIKQEMIADLGVMEDHTMKSVFELGLVAPGRYPFSKGWLVNTSEVLKKIKLPKVSGISVNEISTSKKRIQHYREQLAPVTESMEGAALHYVGLMEKIPFLQLRAVSNYVGERNKTKWDIKNAVAHLNRELIEFIKKLNSRGTVVVE